MPLIQLRKHVHESFEHVRKALDIRERLLTRQIDVLANTSPRPNSKSNGGRPLQLIDQMKFLAENEQPLMEHIRSFGRLNIDNYKFYADPTFAIEDYICPDVDHELMYKCLKGLDAVEPLDPEGNDSSSGAILHLNEQRIVHMTVKQSQELLDHQSNSLRKFELFMSNEADLEASNLRKMVRDGEDEKIAQVLLDNLNRSEKHFETIISPIEQEQPSAVSRKKSKRKIKINQFNGTINLKNISKLTINTSCSRDSLKINQKSILDSQSSPSFDDQPTSYGCEFYNRLINGIKQTLDSTTSSPTTSCSTSTGTNKTTPTTPSSQSLSSDSTTPTTSPPFDCNRMLFQNIRNIINLPDATAGAPSSSINPLESTAGDQDTTTTGPESDQQQQPVQIEQWLKQIITQTELEPVPPSVEILEHSLITESIPTATDEESHWN